MNNRVFGITMENVRKDGAKISYNNFFSENLFTIEMKKPKDLQINQSAQDN